MLSHWLIAVPKSRSADRAVQRRVQAGLWRGIYYVPEQVLFHRHDSGVWLLSVSRGTGVWGMEQPYELRDAAFLAVAGTPTFEADTGIGTPPQRMLRALGERGPNWVFEHVGGVFSVGSLACGDDHGATVSAFADFSGYHSVFYIDTDSFFAVGNRASLVAAFRPGFPGRHEVNADVLSWSVGTTMIMGTETAFAGVSRLRSGHRISIAKGDGGRVTAAAVARMQQDHFASAPAASVDDLALDEVCERMGSRLRWCLDQEVPLCAHLTGGRDTRAVAAVLARQGLLGDLDQYVTNGSERNGDVILGRRVAKALSIEAKHRIRTGNKTERKLGAQEFGERLLRSPYLYEGQISTYDGRSSLLSGNTPSNVTLMGGGGEVYRQEWMSSAELAGPQGVELALNAFCRHDGLNLLSDHAKQWQLQTIGDEIQHVKERGVANLACAFYLEERLSNWGCAHFSNAATAQFPVLLDWQLARLMLSIEDVSEHLPFEIIRHCCRHLLDIPLLNVPWAAATQARAEGLGMAPDPLRVEVKRDYPWQFDCYARYRDALIDFCLEWGSPLRRQVPAKQLEELRQRPLEPFGSARIKMLFGLCNALLFVAEAWHRTPDFNDGEAPALSGNHAATVGNSLVRATAQRSPIQDSLYRHLARVAA